MIITLQVDFFWINRDQKSFEWFVKLLSQLEIEQAEHGGAMSRYHLQFTVSCGGLLLILLYA